MGRDAEMEKRGLRRERVAGTEEVIGEDEMWAGKKIL